MKTITIEEILDLYKKCDASSSGGNRIRTTINTGTLQNQLNTNYAFLNGNTRSSFHSISSPTGNATSLL